MPQMLSRVSLAAFAALTLAAAPLAAAPLAAAQPPLTLEPFADAIPPMSDFTPPPPVQSPVLTLDASDPVVASDPQEWTNFLPLWADNARAQGYNLPAPLGISGNVMFMTAHYKIKQLRVAMGPGAPTASPFISVGRVKVHAQNYLTRLDAWVLPFLNVYGLLGYTTGTADTTATVLPPLSPTGQKATFPVHVHFAGPTYGGGITLATGYKQLFVKLDVNYTYTSLDFPESPVHCFVIDPRIGWRDQYGPFIGSFWVGAMGQYTLQTLKGTMPFLPGAPAIPFEVDQTAEQPWNLILGTQWEFGRHFTAMVEGGLGDRKQIMFSLGLRF